MAVDTTVQVTLPADGRVGHRGHRPGVAQAGGRHGRGRRDPRRDLDRQGRRRGARAGQRDRGQDPRRRGRHRRGRRRARRDRDRERRRARSGHGARPAAAPTAEPSRRRADADAPTTEAARPAARSSTSSPPRAASRSPRARSSSGPSRSATPSRTTRRVVEISTDKVDMELPAPAAGTITEILAEEGETVTVGQVIARMHVGARRARQPRRRARRATAPPRPTAPSAPAAAPRRTPRSPPSPRASPPPRASTSRGRRQRPGRAHHQGRRAGAANGDAPRRPPHRPRRRPPRAARRCSRAARRCSPATWTRAARSRRRPRSARITVTAMDARRKQLKDGRPEGLLHAPDRLRDRPGRARTTCRSWPTTSTSVDGKPHRVDDGAVNLGIAVDVEKKDGTRTLMVPVIRDAGPLDFADFMAAFDELIDKARTNTLTADDLTGAQHLAHQPGRDRHHRLRPAADGRPGHDRRHRLDRLPGRPRHDRRHDRRREGHDDDLDLRPPHHPGRGVGALPAGRRGLPAGRARLLRGRLRRRSASQLGPPPAPPAPAAAAAAARDAPPPRRARRAVDEELLQAVQAATSLLKAHRTHGHLAARLDPLGAEPEGDPALDPEPLGLTPELMAQIPAKILRMDVPGATLADALPHLRETYCGTIAYEIEHIASHRQRVWLREKIETGAFRKPLTTDEQKALLQRLIEVDALERFMHKAYLGQKQFSIEGLDMTVPMLDELIQLAGRARRARGRRRHGAPRPAQRAGPQPRPPLRDDLRRVRGRLDARGRHHDPAGRHRRRQVPPRRAGHLPAAQRRRRSSSTSSPTRRTSSSSHPVVVGATRAAQTDAPGPARPPRHQRGACRSSCTATPPSPARASSRSR